MYKNLIKLFFFNSQTSLINALFLFTVFFFKNTWSYISGFSSLDSSSAEYRPCLHLLLSSRSMQSQISSHCGCCVKVQRPANADLLLQRWSEGLLHLFDSCANCSARQKLNTLSFRIYSYTRALRVGIIKSLMGGGAATWEEIRHSHNQNTT